MQLITPHLIATPCDEEEDNMARLCCHGNNGEMFMLSRYPDEDEVELTWDYEPSTLDGLKVTLSDTTLVIELAAGDADALGGKGYKIVNLNFNTNGYPMPYARNGGMMMKAAMADSAPTPEVEAGTSQVNMSADGVIEVLH